MKKNLFDIFNFCEIFQVIFEICSSIFEKWTGQASNGGPPILNWFYPKLNEEDFLKLSLKNLHPFKKVQNHHFFKSVLKNLTKVKISFF